MCLGRDHRYIVVDSFNIHVSALNCAEKKRRAEVNSLTSCNNLVSELTWVAVWGFQNFFFGEDRRLLRILRRKTTQWFKNKFILSSVIIWLHNNIKFHFIFHITAWKKNIKKVGKDLISNFDKSACRLELMPYCHIPEHTINLDLSLN